MPFIYWPGSHHYPILINSRENTKMSENELVPNLKQSYFPMTDEVSLDFIKWMIQPDNPTLGLWFGWNQPNDDTTVKLGDCYTIPSFNDYTMTIVDLFNTELGPIGFNSARDILKELKSHYGKRYSKYLKPKLSGIWATEVFRQFSELENEEKCIYRLCVMSINTMTELHNFACAYMESLAESYSKNSDEWSLYENDDSGIDEIAYQFNDKFSGLIDFTGYLQYNYSDEEYHYFNEWKVSEYFQAPMDNYDKSGSDFIQDIFGLDVPEYESENILKVLSVAMEWIKSEWNDGILQFHYDESMPDIIKKFTRQFEMQDLLPGFIIKGE